MKLTVILKISYLINVVTTTISTDLNEIRFQNTDTYLIEIVHVIKAVLSYHNV